MRWVKAAALLSLWAFFFALIALAHLWISALGLANRWKIISRLTRSFIFLMRKMKLRVRRLIIFHRLASPNALIHKWASAISAKKNAQSESKAAALTHRISYLGPH